MALLIHTNGATREITPADGERFTFKELYPLLGTDIIETVYLDDRKRLLLIDEEGKLKQSGYNVTATRLAGHAIGMGDYIAGTVVCCLTSEVE